MALFDKWQRTVSKLTHPVTEVNTSPKAVGKDEVAYLQEFQSCIMTLANEVYGFSEPKEIALCALKKACEFYDADWCGIFDVDMMLKFWMPFWWYNRETGGMTKTKLDDGGISGDFPRWMEAIESNIPVFIENIESIKDEYPKEYELMIPQLVQSVLAVPFHRRERGFLLLRNPKRYADRHEILQLMANVLIQEIHEQKLLEHMKLDARPTCIDIKSDVTINLFGGLSICGERGKMLEAEMKSPLCAKMLVLLLMNRKRGMTAREISDILWPDKDYDNPTGNLRSLLFRLRATLRYVTDIELVVTMPNGYRINPDIVVETDYEEFEKICEEQDIIKNTAQKIKELGKAVTLYQGKLFPTGSSEHWLIPYHSRYHLMYLQMLNELMELLNDEKQYELMYDYAMLAISVEPDSPITNYWLVVSLRKHGATDMAKKHLEAAKLRLLEEEYHELKNRLIWD